MTEYLLQLSAPLSVVLLLLLAAQQLLLKLLGARTVYGLWAAVPVLLLSGFVTPLLPVAVSAEPVKRYQVGIEQLAVVVDSVNWLFWLWLAGFMLCLGFLLLSYFSSRVLFNRAIPVALSITSVCCRQADTCTGPYITGLLTPRILLPHDFFIRFDAVQQQLILQHELTHWRRGDLHLNYLALAVVSLFWFNPLVWLGYCQYRQAQELACDALVTANISKAERIAYGYALLSSTQQPPVYGWPLIHHYGEFNTMKQRIMQLQRQHGLSKTIVLSAVAMVVSATILLQQPVMAGAAKVQELAPVMRIEPRYPIQAAKEGIAGFVQLKFDVTPEGKVENVSVIKSSPSGVFDKEAVRALEQWQYNATGKVYKGNLVQLDFELDVVQQSMERISVTPHNRKSLT